jgi:RimJ/RimL family protein N-acetyltransferase
MIQPNSWADSEPFVFVAMTREDAGEIAAWRYPPPYDVYNAGPDEVQSFLNPECRYYSVRDSGGAVIAFRCFGEDARVPGGDYTLPALDMGGGLRPDLCGQGLGPRVMLAAIGFARENFLPPALRATVAEWNLRAQKACEKAGYQPAQRFIAPHSGLAFIIFLRQV